MMTNLYQTQKTAKKQHIIVSHINFVSPHYNVISADILTRQKIYT